MAGFLLSTDTATKWIVARQGSIVVSCSMFLIKTAKIVAQFSVVTCVVIKIQLVLFGKHFIYGSVTDGDLFWQTNGVKQFILRSF